MNKGPLFRKLTAVQVYATLLDSQSLASMFGFSKGARRFRGVSVLQSINILKMVRTALVFEKIVY